MKWLLVTNIPVHAYMTARVEVPDDATDMHDAVRESVSAGRYVRQGPVSCNLPDDLDMVAMDGWAFDIAAASSGGACVARRRIDVDEHGLYVLEGTHGTIVGRSPDASVVLVVWEQLGAMPPLSAAMTRPMGVSADDIQEVER